MHGSVLMLSNSPDPSLTLLFLLEDQGTKLQLPWASFTDSNMYCMYN